MGSSGCRCSDDRHQWMAGRGGPQWYLIEGLGAHLTWVDAGTFGAANWFPLG